MYRWNRKCNIVVWLICLFVLTGCTSKEELIQLNQPEQLVEEASVESVGQPELETQEQEQREKEPGRNPDGEQQTMVAEREEAALAPQKEQKIYVHVCGAVANPGVYEMTSVSRIFEAVEAAGGFTDEADGDYVIQAEMLADGMKIQIPTKAQTAEWIAAGDILMQQEVVSLAKAEEENSITPDMVQQKVNINQADEATLCTITGIGQGRAAAIITYREQNGGFNAIEDIMKVDGIKQATFEKIKEQICVK